MEIFDETRAEALELLTNRRLSLEELWLMFSAHGGTASVPDLAAFVRGLITMSDTNVESLHVTLNKLRSD